MGITRVDPESGGSCSQVDPESGGPCSTACTSTMGDRRMVFGDGLEDIKDCFLGSVPSSSGGGGGLFSRPVIIGSVLLLWMFGLTIALIVVSSKYADLSIVALSSRLDGVEQHHADKHTFALQKIGAVAASHRETAQALGETSGRVKELQVKFLSFFCHLKVYFSNDNL